MTASRDDVTWKWFEPNTAWGMFSRKLEPVTRTSSIVCVCRSTKLEA